jgi:prepilin peptidase CpaA
VAPFLAWTGVAGGALAVSLLLLRRTPVANLVAGPAWVGRLLEPKGDVPYGVAIAVGALAAFPMSPIFHAL